ncbi:MAG: ribonuclease III [Planctomycetaceae bacterium]|jgi:ribonuclease-3|nr:ribonuclease III [Planctomycetaceae bacterium]
MDLNTFLDNCQKQIGIQFRNTELLRTALTHSSGADTPQQSNERMEFLGDSVLSYTICDYLYARFPDLHEGEMTKIKSAVVSRMTCGNICTKIGLDKFLILGRGLGKKSRIPDSVFANLLEAFIAALYLDGGYNKAKDFILAVFMDDIEFMLQDHDAYNFKSLLQNYSQKKLHKRPEYKLVTIGGPEHHKVFNIEVHIGETVYPAAWGITKKTAEQRAAENALAVLHNEPVPYL